MNLTELIAHFQKLSTESEGADFKKITTRIIRLLREIDNKNLTNNEKEKIQTNISSYLEDIQTEKDGKIYLKKLRKSLKNDFGFVSSNFYLAIGIGVGLSIGTALGISFGVPFGNGIVFGPMIGSGIGLIGGLIIGMIIDKKKESENRILKNL